MTLVSILVVGFLLGMKHATEADHLAAVATLATRKGTWADALRQGAAWGLGHTLTLLLFGGVVLALGRSIPTQFEQVLEMVVGLMLLLLGVDVLRRLWRQRIHFHAHAHDDGSVHLHAHSHADAAAPRSAIPVFSQLVFVPFADADHGDQPHMHPHADRIPGRALLVGMMHGMAGSAALIVLSLDAVPSVATGVLYILVFGAGSILGMALLSAAIALPLRASATALTGLHRGMTAAVGLFSCALGLWVMYRIGIVERLLLGG
ncbi:MAG: urease accessory protein [Panacagrimonas sp.]